MYLSFTEKNKTIQNKTSGKGVRQAEFDCESWQWSSKVSVPCLKNLCVCFPFLSICLWSSVRLFTHSTYSCAHQVLIRSNEKYATKYCPDFVCGMNKGLPVHWSSDKTKILVAFFLSVVLEQYVHYLTME